MLPALLAAQPDVFALPDQLQSLLAIGMWVIIGAGVIGTAAASVSIWANLRRQPSVDSTFATKEELLSSENRTATRVDTALNELRNQQRAIFSKLDATNTTMTKIATDFERALGRVEGRLAASEGS